MNRSPRPELVRTPGLDGSNPLGFLAALGLLCVLDHRARRESLPLPHLSWIDDGYWQPVLHTSDDIDTIITAVLEDKGSWADDPAFLLAYDASGGRLLDPRTGPDSVTRDLKPKPDAMRQFLENIAAEAEMKGSNRRTCLKTRRSMDTASAYGSEMVQDNNGNTKPFAFHFTAGQQRFLDALARLQQEVCEDDVREALLGPWKGTSKLPSMSWDATIARVYALRATDPSGEKRGSTPGADWLAFNALGLLLVTPRGRNLVTSGVRGGWKDSEFTWPLWSVPVSTKVVKCLLTMRSLPDLPARERVTRGIVAVFSSSITRSDQGGYGGFSPARVR
ncbi:MAG: type I-G CRISPR-associated protein, Cas3-extension family [Longimicrobiales bacterium]